VGRELGLEGDPNEAFRRIHSRFTHSSSERPSRRSSLNSVWEGSMSTISRLDSDGEVGSFTASDDRSDLGSPVGDNEGEAD
jgi:hypothetical protein